MIKIEEIRLTKRGRYALFCEGEFLFSIDEETLYREKIAEGTTLEEWQLLDLRQKSETRKATEKALYYLGLRDYASGELYQKLCLKFDEHSAAAAVAKMAELALLNDEAFARHRAKYLLQQNRSKGYIARHLADKGITRECVQQVLDELYEADEWSEDELGVEARAAANLVQKSYRRKLEQGKRDAVFQALARRGFSASSIKSALAWVQENDPYGC